MWPCTCVGECSELLHSPTQCPAPSAPENGGYSVSKLKDLSKLHKAVWKDDLGKVKAALASLKKSMYVDYFDKENR